jgi:rhodanese-related sulfurtransferase
MLTITPQELHVLLEKTPDTIELIDVRNTDEFAEIRMI